MADVVDEAPKVVATSGATGSIARMYVNAMSKLCAAEQKLERLQKRASKKDAADSRTKAIGLLLRLLCEKCAAANDAEEDVQVLRGMVARLEGELLEAKAGGMGFDSEAIPFNQPLVCRFGGRVLQLTVRGRDRDERLQTLEVIGEDGKAVWLEVTGRDRYSRISEVKILH